MRSWSTFEILVLTYGSENGLKNWIKQVRSNFHPKLRCEIPLWQCAGKLSIDNDCIKLFPVASKFLFDWNLPLVFIYFLPVYIWFSQHFCWEVKNIYYFKLTACVEVNVTFHVENLWPLYEPFQNKHLFSVILTSLAVILVYYVSSYSLKATILFIELVISLNFQRNNAKYNNILRLSVFDCWNSQSRMKVNLAKTNHFSCTNMVSTVARIRWWYSTAS